MMKRLILITMLFVFLCCPILRAEEISLALDEALAIALRDNRDILLKSEDVKKAKEKIHESEAELFPTLTFTGSMTETKGYYNKDLRQTTTQTTLKQYLYKGGETINSIQQSKYDLDVSRALFDKTKIELALSVKNAFYTLMLAQEFAELNKNIVLNAEEHLDSLLERYQSGEVSESEIFNLDSSLSNTQQAYEESLNQVGSGQAVLVNLLNLNENIRIKAIAQFDYEPVEVAYDEAFIKVMGSRPEIKQYEAQIKSDKEAIEIAKADTRPSIYASWDYYSRSRNAAASKNWNDYNVIGLTLSWPIFDGWLTKAKVEQAIIDLKETRLLKDKAIKDLALELKNSYLVLKDALAQLQAVESDKKAYSDNLISVNKKYSQGIASSLDLKDASLKYDVSIFNKKQAIYDYIIAKGSFDKATGGF